MLSGSEEQMDLPEYAETNVSTEMCFRHISSPSNGSLNECVCGAWFAISLVSVIYDYSMPLQCCPVVALNVIALLLATRPELWHYPARAVSAMHSRHQPHSIRFVKALSPEVVFLHHVSWGIFQLHLISGVGVPQRVECWNVSSPTLLELGPLWM